MSLVLQSSGGGSVTLQEPVTASNLTITVSAVTGTMAIDGPAFSAYQSTDQTGLSSNTYTKCNFEAEEFDTNSNFASSRFTPTVAGYYQVNWGSDIVATGGGTSFMAVLYKNGTLNKSGSGLWTGSATEVQVFGSALVYCNGSTDYLEIYVRATGGSARQTFSGIAYTYFNGAMVRAA